MRSNVGKRCNIVGMTVISMPPDQIQAHHLTMPAKYLTMPRAFLIIDIDIKTHGYVIRTVGNGSLVWVVDKNLVCDID